MKAVYQSGFNIMGTGDDIYEAYVDALNEYDLPSRENLHFPVGGEIHGEIYQVNICPVLAELNQMKKVCYNLQYIDGLLYLVLDDDQNIYYDKNTDKIVHQDLKSISCPYLDLGISESAISNRVSPLKEVNTL